MYIKEGVKILGLKPEALLGLVICFLHFARLGKTTYITEISGGKHHRGSLHYSGNAFDLRTRHLTDDEKEEITRILKQALGENFDVVLETKPPHLHVEYQPKEN